MKTKINKLISMCAALAASLALMIAATGAGNTCVFLTYQPDVPDELKV